MDINIKKLTSGFSTAELLVIKNLIDDEIKIRIRSESIKINELGLSKRLFSILSEELCIVNFCSIQNFRKADLLKRTKIGVSTMYKLEQLMQVYQLKFKE